MPYALWQPQPTPHHNVSASREEDTPKEMMMIREELYGEPNTTKRGSARP